MLPPLPGAAPSFAPPARGLSEALTGIDAFLWGPWLLIPLLLGTGVVLTVRLRGLQLRMLGPALRFALLQREGGGEAADAGGAGEGETRDGPIVISGYVHLKDILYATEAQRSEPIPSWHARALVPVHAGDEVEDVLAAMQRTGAHLGRVEDPEGVTIGVVFLEDILEELIGEVHDAMQRG